MVPWKISSSQQKSGSLERRPAVIDVRGRLLGGPGSSEENREIPDDLPWLPIVHLLFPRGWAAGVDEITSWNGFNRKRGQWASTPSCTALAWDLLWVSWWLMVSSDRMDWARIVPSQAPGRAGWPTQQLHWPPGLACLCPPPPQR